MGEKRFAEEGESLDGGRPEEDPVGVEVENQRKNSPLVSETPLSVDARKQAMIAAAVAREKAHKRKMTLSKRKKTSSSIIKHQRPDEPSSQQASHVPLSEQAKKAAEQSKADEGAHATQLGGWSPYETCQMTSGQARSATVVKKHGTIQNNNDKATVASKKVKDQAVSNNASLPPAFLPPSVSSEFENAYTLLVATNDATAVKASITVMYKLIVNATTKGQDLSTDDSAKFRKVRLSNEKIKAAITHVNGGLDIMQAVGFQLAEDNGETYLVYPPGESGPDWLPDSLEAMRQYGATTKS